MDFTLKPGNAKHNRFGGTVVYNSKDKKEVCYIGRDKTKSFSKVTIAYAGDLKQARKIGILKQL